jgi:hypothetical protein
MGLGRKVWSAGDVLAAADVNGYLMDQSVMVFSNAANRNAAIGTPTAGMHSFRTDGTVVEVYNGSAWVSANSVGGAITISAKNVTNPLTASTATTYDLTANDSAALVQLTAAGTVTVNVNTLTALLPGERIDVLADGAAGALIVAGSGVTLAGGGTAGTAYTLSQYQAASVFCVGSNNYRIIGNVRAV